MRALKSRAIFDNVICREHEHGRTVIARRYPTGAESDCRSGIAFRWFGENILLRKLRQQFADSGFLLDVRQNEKRSSGTSPSNRATVSSRSVLPQISRNNCFGFFRRLSGQKRSPLRPRELTRKSDWTCW